MTPLDDLARWLGAHAFDPDTGFAWEWEMIFTGLDPARFATGLCRFAATTPGKPAALALEAIGDVVDWSAQMASDLHQRPRTEGAAAWLERFTDAVLDQPGFLRACAVAYIPPMPLGEHHFVDARMDRALSKTHEVTDLAEFAESIAADLARRGSPPDAERIWWAIFGGTAGAGSRLVRAAELARRPRVDELRRGLVEGSRDALLTHMPFWARAWSVEPIAAVDRHLLEDLLAHEQMPWLARYMKFQLDRGPL